MQQQTELKDLGDFSGGLVTYQSLFSVPANATPNALNIKFGIGGGAEKRLGSTTLNSVALVSSAATGFLVDSGGTLAQSLQAYWKLDETGGPRGDAFGTNTLADNNGVGYVAGVRLNAAAFVAANSQFLSRLSVPALLSNSGSFTVAGWVAFTSTAAYAALAGKYGANNATQEWLLDYDPSVQRFRFILRSSSGTAQVVSSTVVAVTTAAQFVAAWLDVASSQILLQVTNATVGSLTSMGSVVPPADTSTQVTFGASSATDPPTGDYFQGWLDEWGFWKKALTAQERRDLFNLGSGNTYNAGAISSGWGLFDFGASLDSTKQPLRWIVVAAGTGIYASSNRGVSFLVVATDRLPYYQEFERSKSFLIAVADTYNKVLYWAGSAGTYMLPLAVGSAPPSKHALDFNGYLLLMNNSAGTRQVVYAPNISVTTDPWTSSFEITSSYDDEITGSIVYNQAAYIFTKYTVSRVSPVGGNPDFSVRQVRSWGAVPGTIKKVTIQGIGEVIMCLGWDRHIRIFDGMEDRIISTPIEQDNGQCPVFLSGIPTAQLHKCRAEVDTEEQVYKLWMATPGSTETIACLNFDLRTQAWYAYSNQGFQAAVMSDSQNSRILVGVKRDGFVHWINTTNTDAGVPIDEYYDSPLLFTTPRTVTKRQKLTCYFKATSSGTLLFQDRTDFAMTYPSPRDRVALADTTTAIHVAHTIDVPVTQNVYQFRVSSSASTADPWLLTRVDTEGRDVGLGKA